MNLVELQHWDLRDSIFVNLDEVQTIQKTPSSGTEIRLRGDRRVYVVEPLEKVVNLARGRNL